MADETMSKEEFDKRTPDIAAAALLKQLGYSVDAGGPLYFLSLGQFLQKCSDEEKKLAMTPEGLVMVLHRRLDAIKNAEAEKNGPTPLMWVGIAVAAALAIFLIKETDKG